jgi:DnaJ-class molecular chaperone
MPELKPIVEMPYKRTNLVVCNDCRGTKKIFNGDKQVPCPLCLGEGFLQRVSEGIMKLYTLK